ncbi:MAG: glycine zipper domain-containing protein [Novosphingobium sp.]
MAYPSKISARPMKRSRAMMAALAAVSLVTVSACTTDPNTGQKRISSTAIGAGVGAVGGLFVGSLIGGAGAELLGAGIGGVAGAAIGSKKDAQRNGRREQTSGTGVDPAPVDNGSGSRR